MRTEGARRYYGTVRNRWRFLLETYQWRTLLLCLPSLLIYEISLVLFVCKKGAIRDYFRAVAHVLRNLRPIFEARKKIQSKRKLKDKELMTSGSVFVAPEYMNSKVLSAGFKGMNAFLNCYWFLVR